MKGWRATDQHWQEITDSLNGFSNLPFIPSARCRQGMSLSSQHCGVNGVSWSTLQPHWFGVRCPEGVGFWSLTVPLGFSSMSSSQCSRLCSPSLKAILDWKGTGNDSWEIPLELLAWTPRYPYTFCEAGWERKVLFTIVIDCEKLGLWLWLHFLQPHIAFWKLDLPSQWKVSDGILYVFNSFQLIAKKKEKKKVVRGIAGQIVPLWAAADAQLLSCLIKHGEDGLQEALPVPCNCS